MIHFLEEAEKRKDELIYLLAHWVAIPSVYDQSTVTEDAPFGKEVGKALQWFEDLGTRDGFSTKNIDEHAVYVEYGHAKEHICIFGHGDVVPAGEGWETDPYQLKVIDGRAYGRGVVDNKGPMVCCYLALKIIKDLNLQTKHRIRVVVGGNEESGFQCIRHYFSKEPQPKFGFTPDAKFPVIYGEKGGMLLEFKGKIDKKRIQMSAGISRNTIPPSIQIMLPPGYEFLRTPFCQYIGKNNLKGKIESIEKGLYIELIGRGGHSSKPDQAINPITMFMEFLSFHVNETWVMELGKLIIHGNEKGESFSLSTSGKCGELTIVPTMLYLSDGEFSIIFDIRYPEGATVDFVEEKIRKYLSENMLDQVSFKVENVKRPNYVDPDSELVKKLHGIYMKHTKDTQSKVRFTSAGTYASEMKNSVVFGAEFGDDSSGNVHGANEYIEIDRLVQAMAIYAEAMVELANM